jgi:predicted Zn-dependent peptidase
MIYEQPNNNLPITSINVYCDVGSGYECEKTRGASHFIEHMCFKGSSKFKTAKDIFNRYDKYGVEYNANTHKRYTCYILKTQNEYLEECVDIISNVVLNSTFPKKEFKKEEHVVIEENIKNSDDYDDVLSLMMDRELYKGCSYENPVDDISYHTHGKHFEYKDVLAMYHHFYRPNNLIFSIVSTFSFQKIKDLIANTDFIKKVPENITKWGSSINLNISPINEPIVLLKNIEKLNTSHIYISFRICDFYSPDKYTLNLLRNILSGYLSSRLFMLLREKHGLTYTSGVYTEYHENIGSMSFYAEVDHNKVIKNEHTKGVLPLLIELLNDLRKNGVTKKELDVAKNNIRGKIIINLEDANIQANYNGLELLYRKDESPIIPYSQIYTHYYKPITVNGINEAIKKYYIPNKMVVGIIGSGIPSEKEIRKICEQFRE